MWIFGYGSLMWDGWEQRPGFQRCAVATLLGYQRIFNKASIRNWGNRQHLGPTLNIEPSEGAACMGVAFEFSENSRDEVLAYLRDRKGPSFELRELRLCIPGEGDMVGTVQIYRGRNILASNDVYELAALVRAAKGTSGSCADYVVGVAHELTRLNIENAVVTSLCQVLLHEEGPTHA
ncbi:MAG: hypothetical protein GEU95_18345 [Rhizobiales bacterium]|nr:hypothetical protein [Hyphomicrobiales bacterium]